MSGIWKDMCSLWQNWTLQKGIPKQKNQVVNEMEIDESQECSEGELETVSINSVHLNKNQSLLMVELDTQAGDNSTVIPYKIDTRSEGNIMPLFTFKKLFKNITEDQPKKTIKAISDLDDTMKQTSHN